MASKKYGLIVPEKGGKQLNTLKFQASRNVFGNESDSDDDTKKKTHLLRPSDNINRQAKISQEKALLEDPTVYQYDEIYDEVKSKKEKVKIKEERKPKYIENLIKTANKRKLENERRVERQIQKEREKEGDEFKDKEVFVTSAYKKKLEEMKIEEEKEKREEYLESIGDVTKQHDLGGFYRHLYEQKLGNPDSKECKSTETMEKMHTNKPSTYKDPTETLKKRNYRKREVTNDNALLSDGEIEDSDEEVNRVNLEQMRKIKRLKKDNENIDADSDFSIDDPSDEENENDPKTKKSTKGEVNKSDTDAEFDKQPKTETIKLETQNKNNKKKNAEIEAKEKIDIWKKRTVGLVFEEALKRYYDRKAARGH